MNDLTLQVDGMTCAVCVGNVERALKDLHFVANPSVNVAAENAKVSLDDPADIARIAEALAHAGYPVVTDRLELAVEGLVDAAAVTRAERALAARAGVIEARVNLATETATVTIAAGALPATDLVEALAGAGFAASIRTGAGLGQAARREAEIRRLGWLTIVAALLTLPVFVVEMGGHLYPPFHHWIMSVVPRP